MIVVSNDFKTAMKQPVKELQAFIDAGDFVIREDGDSNNEGGLISFKVSCDSGLCKSAMRKLEAKYLGEHNLVGKWVTAGFGVKLASGAFEYLNYGSFLVSEQTTTKDTGVTEIVAYDKMINAMEPYVKLETDYPISLYDYTAKLCGACGIELGNAYFGNNLLRNITEYLWRDNADGFAEVAGDHIKVVMPETPTQFSGVYATAVKESLTGILGRKVAFSFYAKADAERTIMFQSAGEEGYHYINLTTEWQRYHYVVDNFEFVSPTFYCGDTLDKTPYYIKDIMIEETGVLTEYKAFNQMNDWQIERELWENINGITYRDIFVQIAQATASTCIIRDDKVYFKPITATGEQLTYANMMKLKLEPLYGEINSVVLSRAPQEDNVYLRDEDSIAAMGLTEFRIENNEIVDKDRENALPAIADGLLGVSYYPFETTTEGLGWYEIGDHFYIVNDTGDVFPTVLFNYSITIDGGIKETLKTTVESKAQTQYQYAKSIAKRVRNAEIIVNKQDQYIESIVSDMDGIKDNYTQIYQDIDRIEQRVQNSGGSNLLKNSVMFSLDSDGKPHEWKLHNDAITIQDDAEALHNGGISGRSFTLTDNEATQRVNVKVSTETDPATYSFSIRIKKGEVGSCSVTLFNDVEEHDLYLSAGESAYYGEYVIEGLRPQMNYYSICIGTSGGTATFTDCMFAAGDYKSKWTQASGEVMNTQVCVSIDGVVVKRDDGDYTAMTPQEFAGYSHINGTPVRVFSVNKDVTWGKKLEATDEVKMAPIKVVSITEGDIQGWAFVPST